MTAGIYNLLIEQGSATTVGFEVVNDQGILQPLTGCSARASIKRGYDYQLPLSVATTSVDEATSIVYVTFDGILPFNYSGEIPAGYDLLPFKSLPKLIQSAAFVWDLKLVYPSEYTSRLLQGVALVTPQVTE